ncbi:MAG: acyl-CoA thioesterase [Pseudomonadota bacterium]|nr:acyl-CoA thioesterase [Pseudomonadota bacterium]
MWFLLRFLIALHIQKIKPSKSLLDWVFVEYRCMPWDLDANIHMNNVKYLKYLERGRVENMIHTPWLQDMHGRGYKALIANTEISYVKEIRPFQRFKVSTRISSWDEKYIYMEQVMSHRQTVFTAAVIRMAMVNSKTKRRESPMLAFAEIAPGLQPPPLPDSARHLNLLVQAQRGETPVVTGDHGEASQTVARTQADNNQERIQ